MAGSDPLPLRAFVRSHTTFELASDSASIERVLASGRIAVIPCLEGLEAVEQVDDVDLLYRAGARVASLVHFTDNGLADAEDDQFGSLAGALLNGRNGGLTALGRATIERMMALGMVIDLSHASDRTSAEVLALVEARRVPVISSHTGAGMQRPFTVSDEVAARIARLGGMIGIGIFRSDFLKPLPESELLAGHVRNTCDDVLARWSHYARIVGPSSVTLGSDLSSVVSRPLRGGHCPEGIRHVGDIPSLLAGLREVGISRNDFDLAVRRWIELWSRVELAANPGQRAHAMKSTPREAGFFESGL